MRMTKLGRRVDVEIKDGKLLVYGSGRNGVYELSRIWLLRYQPWNKALIIGKREMHIPGIDMTQLNGVIAAVGEWLAEHIESHQRIIKLGGDGYYVADTRYTQRATYADDARGQYRVTILRRFGNPHQVVFDSYSRERAHELAYTINSMWSEEKREAIDIVDGRLVVKIGTYEVNRKLETVTEIGFNPALSRFTVCRTRIVISPFDKSYVLDAIERVRKPLSDAVREKGPNYGCYHSEYGSIALNLKHVVGIVIMMGITSKNWVLRVSMDGSRTRTLYSASRLCLEQVERDIVANMKSIGAALKPKHGVKA